MDEDADVEPTPDGSPADDDATDRTESTAADPRSQEAAADARQRPDDDASDDGSEAPADHDGDEDAPAADPDGASDGDEPEPDSDANEVDTDSDANEVDTDSDANEVDTDSDGGDPEPDSDGDGADDGGGDATAAQTGGPEPDVPTVDDGPSHDAPNVPEDVRKYARFKKMDGAQYERVNEFLRDRTYITAREWAIARLCSDFRTETGVEMTKIGDHLPRLVPFMTDTYTPQAVNQARSAFDDKVRKAGATFLYGAMSDFYTAEELDDVMYEVTEVAKFLLEVEGVDLTVEEELDAEERISSVMREVRKASRELRTEDLTANTDDSAGKDEPDDADGTNAEDETDDADEEEVGPADEEEPDDADEDATGTTADEAADGATLVDE